MNRRSNIPWLTFLLALFIASPSIVAQNIEYVGELVVNSQTGKSYFYTKSVTLSAPTNGSLVLTDGFFVKPIAINPPPTEDKNYLRVEIPRVPVTSAWDLTNMDGSEKGTYYTYTDGMERTLITSAAEASPLHEDVVQYYKYEANGRQEKTYLPYVKAYTKPGSFISDAQIQTENFYNGGSNIPVDDKYFQESKFDAKSRLNESIGLGQKWNSEDDAQDKKTSYEYKIHDPAVDAPIAHWKIENGVLSHDRFYVGNELSIVQTSVDITTTADRKARIATDMRGLTITRQAYDADQGKWFGTYYVYDEFEQLRFIVPPLMNGYIEDTDPNKEITTQQLNELLFQYEYDERGRMKRQKAPGAGWIEYVYDRWDRLVLHRQAEQKFNGGDSWTFYKYDALNRLVYSGQVKTSKSRTTLQSEASQSSARWEVVSNSGEVGYSLYQTFPNLLTNDYDDYEVRVVRQYDDYLFLGNVDWDVEPHDFSFQAFSGFTGSQSAAVIDQVTGSKVKVLGTNTWLNTVIYYDSNLRPLQVIAENHLGGLDIVTNELDWNSQLKKTLLRHTPSNSSKWIEVLGEYEYAHNGQLLRTWQTIDEQNYNGDRVLVAEYKYNQLSQMIEKNLHSNNGTSFLQSIDYEYNIRGWLSSINNPDLDDGENDLFGMQFNYAEPLAIGQGSPIPARYDGLVSSMVWNSDNSVGTNGIQGDKTALGFNYNGRNRIADTKYAVSSGSSFDLKAGHYDMSATYDDNGNIETLTRKSKGDVVDDLMFTPKPSSNKVDYVDDAEDDAVGFKERTQSVGTEYGYDEMGNMTHDLNKDIFSIEYNDLQLAEKIRFDDGGTEIRFTYDAAGNRLSKAVFDGNNQLLSKIDYVGLFEYFDGEINQIYTDEGRAYKQNDEYHYEYFIRDHQGNNRLSFGNLPERNIYTATMEPLNSGIENLEFQIPSAVRTPQENHTPLGEESAGLNGGVAGRELGPAKVLPIQGNDEVEIEVWAKYDESVSWNGNSIGSIISIINSAFGGASAGTGAEGASGSLNTALNNPGSNIFNGNSANEPQAYLQYIFFDENYNYVPGKSNFKEVGSASDGNFAKLESGKLTFPNPGYLFVYVVNESNQNADVFFDDLSITHASGTQSFKVSQVNEFYPYGMKTAKSWKSPGYVDPGLLYQSYFSNYDSLSGTYDFLLRNYDPATGRWLQVDPYNQFTSPYVGMGNFPHMSVDPDGGGIVGTILGAAALWYAGGAISAAIDGQPNWYNPAKWGRDDHAFAIAGGVVGGLLGSGFQLGDPKPLKKIGGGKTGRRLVWRAPWRNWGGGASGGGLVQSLGNTFTGVTTTAATIVGPTVNPIDILPDDWGRSSVQRGDDPILSLDRAIRDLSNVPYNYGHWIDGNHPDGTVCTDSDCSGIVSRANFAERKWGTQSGTPPGDWVEIIYNIERVALDGDIDYFLSLVQRGDLFVWQGQHAAWYSPNNAINGQFRIFHGFGPAGNLSRHTFSLEGYLRRLGAPRIFRERIASF